ncbi:hypothetical protein SLE2022_281780 [Rubroshorea leprosula]
MEGGKLDDWGSSLAGLMFIWATFQQFFPQFLKDYVQNLWYKLLHYFKPTMQITFNEFSPGLYRRSEAYTTIESYLSSKSAAKASRLRAEIAKESKPLVLALDDHEYITDNFHGVEVKWYRGKQIPERKTISWSPHDADKRYYILIFHAKHRQIIAEEYVNYVLEEGRAIQVRRRQRRLYMNGEGDEWNFAVFDHPASFDTFAMDPQRKEQIVDDLITFSQGKGYYKKIGKVWKRGYLLYGPPGTGKSTMIVAMSNLLGYDIYDLELTTVKDNAELKRLLINTKSKSIMVIEDIDCSLGFTGKRKKDKNRKKGDNPMAEKAKEKEGEGDESKVTLSGLLNFIDGIWSACAGERIVVFTTNHVDQLDPALIRRGRMDMHIKLSYCTFGAFKFLAKNYLDIDSHPLFEKIGELLEVTEMTPADVAENLTPKKLGAAVETCLEAVIHALEIAKEARRAKAQKEDEEQKETETESVPQ